MTYRAETTLNYGLERAWSLATARESNELAIGYDEGTVLIKLGHDAPVASLDTCFFWYQQDLNINNDL